MNRSAVPHPHRGVVGLGMLSTALATGLACLPPRAPAADVTYGVGQWPEAGRGNHRAVVRVNAPAEAVRAHLEWRRRDQKPETKDIRVIDAATGQPVRNVVPVTVTREVGDLVFQPATAPGLYEVYYLPYNPGTGNFDDAGTYLPPQDTADPAWRQRHGLQPEALAAGAWRNLPAADLVEIQARSEFHRLDAMEVIATRAEVDALLAAHPDAPVLLFPEDRRFPVRMFEDLPQRWARSGPRAEFAGDAQPGEFYPFQIGVWAARAGLTDLAVDLGELRSPAGATIPAASLTCFNKTGRDWLGRPLAPTFAVGQGQVRPLWLGVAVPAAASGTYTGTVTLRPAGLPPLPVAVRLTVAGSVPANGGVDDLWRLSRLAWLNSTLGLDDEVVPPYTPLRVSRHRVACLDREVTFDPLGLPESITSRRQEILAAPIAVTVDTAGGPVTFEPGRTLLPKQTPATVERSTAAAGPGLTLTTRSRLEADGCLSYRLTLGAVVDTDLRDVRLDVPVRRAVATYLMGFGRRGGYRPPDLHWTWNIDHADNQLWIGDAEAGLQLTLQGPRDVWDVVTLRDAGLPASWWNDGHGGADVTTDGDTVRLRAYSGPRRLAAGQELEFRFRFLITPFHSLDPRHWNWRYGDFAQGGNILHIHHGCPENPYINYPFLETARLTETIRQAKTATRRTDAGQLTYPAAGNLDPRQGALHLWVRVDFDPALGQAGQARFNQELFSLDFANEDSLGFYWNIDVRGLRAYVRQGSPTLNQYPSMVDAPTPGWQPGQRHVLTLSWGADRLAILVDGTLLAEGGYRHLADCPPATAVLRLASSGFSLDAVKVSRAPFTPGPPPVAERDPDTLLLDTFASLDGTVATRPGAAAAGTRGSLTGVVRWEPGQAGGGRRLVFASRELGGATNGVNLYYTVRELSNHVAEMWPLRSLGNEVFQTRETFIYSVEKTLFGQAGGGYPWLQEHLVTGYVPAWRQPLPWLQDTDAAIGTQGLSRWHNYYVEGMQWLMQSTGLDGLYLDGIGYDREIMKRIAKVMVRSNPNSRINFHSGNNYDFMNWHTSAANSYLEHFPYISNLWFGELFDYDRSPDYWFVEISGIPFGLTSEMLEYSNGGNPYRGMVYGMTGRQHRSAVAMWRFWDEFGIQSAEWLGYWSPECPVRTDRDDVLATVYRKPHKALIALAHWPAQRQRQQAVAPLLDSLPATADGRLPAAAWDAAARLANFSAHGSTDPATDATEVRVLADRQRLHLAFRCLQPAGHPPKATVTSRDGALWEDDAVEIFLQPEPPDGTYYQVIGNSAGAICDTQGQFGRDWTGHWEYRASVADGAWEGELSIPLADLGIEPGTGDVTLGFNVCRDQQTPATRLSCWSPMVGGFHNPEQFGRLTLSATQPTTRQEPGKPTPPETVTTHLRVDWKALGLNPKKVRLTAPPIAHFQAAAEFAVGQPIPVPAAKGWLILAEER